MYKVLKISRELAKEKLISLLSDDGLERHLQLAINMNDIDLMCINDIDNDEHNHYYDFTVGDNGPDDAEFSKLEKQVMDRGPIPYCDICKTNHFQSGIGRCDIPVELW